MRGVTGEAINASDTMHISTHTPHARRDRFIFDSSHFIHNISTHTPHARRDDKYITNGYWYVISTHTPHARRDPLTGVTDIRNIIFQLTRLMRGVTAGQHIRHTFLH